MMVVVLLLLVFITVVVTAASFVPLHNNQLHTHSGTDDSSTVVLYASKRRPKRTQSTSSSNLKRQEVGGGVPQQWRIFGVEVHPDDLVPEITSSREDNNDDEEYAVTKMDNMLLHPAILKALYRRLGIPLPEKKESSNNNPFVKVLKVVRQSVDARRGGGVRRQDGGTGPRFVYVIDVETTSNIPPTSKDNSRNSHSLCRLRHQPGKTELLDKQSNEQEESRRRVQKSRTQDVAGSNENKDDIKSNSQRRDVIIIGAGPAGLFCALQLLAQNDKNSNNSSRGHFIRPIILERGQSVEKRGKSIGALIHRQALDAESNFCFGEGGAGTWSDGKLTTRIGRNSKAVRLVLETLVQYGAPRNLLVEGAPHLGTDNLVKLLRNMRMDLQKRGGEIWFGTKMTELIVQDGCVKGVRYEKTTATSTTGDDGDSNNNNNGVLYGDAVVLATGHSARDVYEQLHVAGVELQAKGFAVGFRVEHPQKWINKMQYGKEWGQSVVTGRKTTDSINQEYFGTLAHNGDDKDTHTGRLPVPSYRLATNEAFDGEQNRGVYSFCMCPGGQIVPTSTDPNEVCVNGMSFSRRDSLWANSALVATVAPDDPILEPYRKEHGVMAGLAFQREMEQRAAIMGGGNLKVPVQRVTDFVAARPSTSAPSSSYRLGVTPAPCHEIYPPSLTASIRNALVEHFDKQMPGFVSDDGLLHAVETRTSSPVRVSRDEQTMQSIGASGLFPAGEGAGFAGGIVSAAVDGLAVAEAVWAMLFGDQEQVDASRTFDAKGITSFY